MTPSEQQQIKYAHYSLPNHCRRDPASPEQLAAFETEFGPIPTDYRWYLAECGGGVIGSERIDGIKELASTHRKVRQAQTRGFYPIPRFFPLGWDGFGNVYGYNLETGHIIMQDHNFGGIHELADGLYALIRKKGLLSEF